MCLINAEVVVAKLSSKTDHSRGIESTGRIQVGDVVTGISINNEEMQYLAVGSETHQRGRSSEVYMMLKNARGHVRLQVERQKEEDENENSPQRKQFQRAFVQGWWDSTKTLIKRQLKITKRLHMLIKLRLFQAIVLGLFAGTAFYKMGGKYSQTDMNSVRALGFVTTMNVMLINLVQLPLNMLQRPIFYKQRSQRFFRVTGPDLIIVTLVRSDFGQIQLVANLYGLQVRPRTNFAEVYHSSKLALLNTDELNSLRKQNKRNALTPVASPYPASYRRQAAMVLLRTNRFLWRNVQYTFGRLTGCILIGFLMGSLYFQIKFDDIYSLTSRSLYIYMQIVLIGVISANNVIPQIGTDRLVYFREKRAGMYAPIFYPISWAVAEIPYFLIATLALAVIGNGMAGISTDKSFNFLLYWLSLFVFTLSVTYFGMMVTFLASVPTLAAFAVSIVTSFWVTSSGVVVSYSQSKFYKWLFWSNPFQYAINTLTSLSFFCDTKSQECLQPCINGVCPPCKCQRLQDNSFAWDRLHDLRSISKDRIPSDFVALTGMCILFAGLAFLFFVILKHNSRPSN